MIKFPFSEISVNKEFSRTNMEIVFLTFLVARNKCVYYCRFIFFALASLKVESCYINICTVVLCIVEDLTCTSDTKMMIRKRNDFPVIFFLF